ncbi:fumarylacetoacetate hydrolase family protein [Streptomyces sp. MK37H]|uniref:fumarylacetoacetate hydrolase family protein n=1 Tax=Streptomyces sp. MK37H TaxID=2699117 RepID=UPI001B3747C7|nr:fumarylacetoacetate hydrolase family protein [Streptomyces sp. MK37H]MBP8534076.1 fumarylacetoacetate hydrolase [Streptomyces sp. MK37H]
MRLGLYDDRLVLITGHRSGTVTVVDVAEASGGRFGPDPMHLWEVWDDFRAWAADRAAWAGRAEGRTVEHGELGPPVPRPRQIFAIGTNYRGHAAEIGLPAVPSVFTKFVTCLTGPDTTVPLPSDTVDWEVELVAVIGRRADGVPRERAWEHVAGLMVGQDLSERTGQFATDPAQFSLAKSHPGFGPTGPWLTTLDELTDPADLAIVCRRGEQELQSGHTSQMIFDVPELIGYLSAVTPLLPGDLIFTGTPSGVGHGRTPRQYLRSGDRLVSAIEGLGRLHQQFTAA